VQGIKVETASVSDSLLKFMQLAISIKADIYGDSADKQTCGTMLQQDNLKLELRAYSKPKEA
jgi:hypothetical protein